MSIGYLDVTAKVIEIKHSVRAELAIGCRVVVEVAAKDWAAVKHAWFASPEARFLAALEPDGQEIRLYGVTFRRVDGGML